MKLRGFQTHRPEVRDQPSRPGGLQGPDLRRRCIAVAFYLVGHNALDRRPDRAGRFARKRDCNQQARFAFQHLFEPGSPRRPFFNPQRMRGMAPMIRSRLMSGCPSSMCVLVSPPVDFCNGTSPSHAMKSRQVGSWLMSGPKALSAIALTGRIPSAVCKGSGSRLASSFIWPLNSSNLFVTTSRLVKFKTCEFNDMMEPTGGSS